MTRDRVEHLAPAPHHHRAAVQAHRDVGSQLGRRARRTASGSVGYRIRSARSTAAASAEPPPSPPPTGVTLVSVEPQPSSGGRSARAARTDEVVVAGGDPGVGCRSRRGGSRARRARDRDPVGRCRDRDRERLELVEAVGAGPEHAQRQGELGRRHHRDRPSRRALIRPPGRARAQSSRRERLGAGRRIDARRRQRRRSPRRRARPATRPAASCGAARTRRARARTAASPTARRPAARGWRTSSTSADSTRGAGMKTLGGTMPTTRAAAKYATFTDTAP